MSAHLSDPYLATIEALVLAMDAKDQPPQEHVRRAQVYAAGLARAFQLSDPEIHGVKMAALLHDIGNIGVPEYVLSKPGPLTREEFQKIRMHPQIGAEIIAAVPFPYPVAPLIRSHHERWDGNGYPDGLKGSEIPIGARILAVVDCFDALISDRPYHKKMTPDAALELLRQEAGKALDPEVVARFIELLPQLDRELDKVEGIAPGGAAPDVFENIALAHREIHALYEIAQSMGTSLAVDETMSVITAKLSKLVPFSTCALFLYNAQDESLRCRFASGLDAHVLRKLAMQGGEGLTGWVARNRRPLVNGQPQVELLSAGIEPSSTVLRAALIWPLVINERFIGTLSLYHTEPDFYTDDHCRLLERVCEQVAAVVHNATVFEQTQEDSLTDPLTGLANTRHLFMHLGRELARSERRQAPLALVVIDIDNFKEINDLYGHHIGDRALREVAQVLRKTIRPYDLAVRYAGDEFVLVLSECPPDRAEQKRVELRRAVEAMAVEARPGKQVRLQISSGAAVFPDDGRAYEALLATADKRMYREKAARKAARANAPATSEAGPLAAAGQQSELPPRTLRFTPRNR